MPDDTNPRLVRFSQSVERAVYPPEAPTPNSPSLETNTEQDSVTDSSDIDQEFTGHYRDGIHVQLREPSVKLDLSGSVNPTDIIQQYVLKAPATVTHVSTFIISSRSLPCKITVSRQDGHLTVHDVLDGIISSLRLPAAKVSQESQQTDRGLFLRVDLGVTIRWIDLLPQHERVFFGLSSEQGSGNDHTERILKVTSYLYI
ncbi:hypothetical protein C0993_008226 [Termitomyces sp. T159_Od127]|nr:hypothetical protein C0993_008226 [Termitomyces sp. T159_Od127]